MLFCIFLYVVRLFENKEEINQDHRGGLNIRLRGRVTTVEVEVKLTPVPALPEETVSIVENIIKDICRNAHLKTMTHLFKITSMHLKLRKKKMVKSTFKWYWMKFMKQIQTPFFFWRMFEEESRNNKNDKAVSITALAVSAIAPTIDRLARMSKTMV